MTTLRVLRESFLLQLGITRRSPGHALILVVAPLHSAIFISLAVSSHRPSAVVNAILAPGLIGLWVAALNLAGQIIAEDRWAGRFELMVTTRVPLGLVVFGRVAAVVLFGMLTFAESWLVAALGFGRVVPIAEPLVFVAAVAATCIAMAGTATLLAAAFVLSRAMEVFQNSMSYPFYILGGVLVPIAALPGPLRPAGRLVFLSWSADLLRAAVGGTASDRTVSIGAILGLGLLAFAAGMVVTRRVVDQSRRDATVGHA